MNSARNPTVGAKTATTPPARLPARRQRSLPPPDSAWRDLVRAARSRYRGCGLFAWFFARGKLVWDPVFRSLLERGDIPPGSRVLDIGCGQGLMASLLAAVDDAQAHGRWPAEWPAAPIGSTYTGIELMPRDVARANQALGGLAGGPNVVCADMVEFSLPPGDVVVILDVLHYVDHSAQQALLTQVRESLSTGGRLLLRVGDMTERRGFAVSQWTDRIITGVRGHRIAPTFCRPLADWVALLEQLGFADVRSVPMSRGTPFANVLLIAEKP